LQHPDGLFYFMPELGIKALLAPFPFDRFPEADIPQVINRTRGDGGRRAAGLGRGGKLGPSRNAPPRYPLTCPRTTEAIASPSDPMMITNAPANNAVRALPLNSDPVLGRPNVDHVLRIVAWQFWHERSEN
jgi:hypothetical protein